MSKQNQTLIVGFALFLMAILPVFSVKAQDSHIVPDEPISVSIGDDPAWLIYSAQAGDRISISTSDSLNELALDTTLEILYPDGRRFAYNDDSILADGSVQSNAMLSNLTMPIAGEYRIRVDSFNGVSEGDVLVSLTNIENPPDDTMQTDNLTIIRAQIPQGGIYRYQLDVQAGETWSIMARDISGTLDPILQIMRADGEILATNDDHLSFNASLNLLDAYVSDLSASEDTSWQIEIRDFWGTQGNIEVIISP